VIDLSVIVASYNTRDLLCDCLSSIYDTTKTINFEIIVVDDCSRDGSPEMVRDAFPDVRLICNATNLRYAKTNNAGLRAARGRYGLLLNSDVLVQKGAFEALVEFMDAHPDAAAAGPKLINPDGSTQHCIRSFPRPIAMAFQSRILHRIWPNNPVTDSYYNTRFDYTRAQAVQSIGTTSFIIRRSTWEKYGMLDERLTLAFVDLAYCRALGQANQKIYFVPDAVVLHYSGQSINQNGQQEIKLLHRELRKFYDYYFALQHNPLSRMMIRGSIRLRERVKLVAYRLSSDKRVLSTPGVFAAPRRNDRTGGQPPLAPGSK
jgi:GT2 family glycosyltransferase